MSKRLQVLLEETELQEIRAIAQRQRMTVSEWVRQSLRQSRSRESPGDVGAKLTALRRATESSFPTADIDQMLAEIENGKRDEAV